MLLLQIAIKVERRASVFTAISSLIWVLTLQLHLLVSVKIYIYIYTTIKLKLYLGTRRNFSLREIIPTREKALRKSRTFNIPLAHNSVRIDYILLPISTFESPDVASLSSLRSCMLLAKKISNTQSLPSRLSTSSSHHFHANPELLLNPQTAASTSHSVFTGQIFDRLVHPDVTVESPLSCVLI